MTETSTLFRLKALRAAPVGWAAAGPARKQTFNASLAQFSELLEAARSVGPASRPLPLFYALSQGGRALSAAARWRGELWRLKGHGLTAGTTDVPLLELSIAKARPRKPKKDEPPPETVDSFAGIATLFDGATLKAPVLLGDVWASIPSVAHLLSRDVWPAAPRPIIMAPTHPVDRAAPSHHLAAWHHLDVTAIDSDHETLLARLVNDYLPAGAPTPRLYMPQGVGPQHEWIDSGYGVRLAFDVQRPSHDGHVRTLRSISPDARQFEEFSLMPKVGGSHLSLMARWWLVLFGLSMVARYEPGRWLAALDLGEQRNAAAIEELLEVALVEIPEVLLAAISRMASIASAPFSEEND